MRLRTARCLDTARSRLRHGLKRDGRCGSPARNAACAGVSIEACRAEVCAAGSFDAGDLIAVRREVQVERKHFALGESMLEPQRDHGLVHLRRDPRVRAGCRRFSSSLAACCEIVDPPSTTSALRGSSSARAAWRPDRRPGATRNGDPPRRWSPPRASAADPSAVSLTLRVPSPTMLRRAVPRFDRRRAWTFPYRRGGPSGSGASHSAVQQTREHAANERGVRANSAWRSRPPPLSSS